MRILALTGLVEGDILYTPKSNNKYFFVSLRDDDKEILRGVCLKDGWFAQYSIPFYEALEKWELYLDPTYVDMQVFKQTLTLYQRLDGIVQERRNSFFAKQEQKEEDTKN